MKKQRKKQFIHEQDLLLAPMFHFNSNLTKSNLKNEKSFSFEEYINDKKVNKTINISCSDEYPDAFCFEVWNALMYLAYEQSQTDGNFSEKVYFNFNDICSFLNRDIHGKLYKAIEKAIDKLVKTTIEFKNKIQISDDKRKYEKLIFHPIEAFYLKGTENPEGLTINKSYIVLNKVITKNLNHNFFIQFDVDKYRQLNTSISKVLYMKLKPKFHKLTKEGIPFYHKKYSDICNDWLILKPQKYKSKIISQLGKHIDELITNNVIKTWEIRKGGNDWIIRFYLPLDEKEWQEFLRQEKNKEIKKEMETFVSKWKSKNPLKFAEMESESISEAKRIWGMQENSEVYETMLLNLNYNKINDFENFSAKAQKSYIIKS